MMDRFRGNAALCRMTGCLQEWVIGTSEGTGHLCSFRFGDCHPLALFVASGNLQNVSGLQFALL